MKILFQNRDPSMHQGGDWVQIQKTMEALKLLGVECDFEHSWNTNLEGYDLVHLHHINFGWTNLHLQNCRKQGKKVILTAIFYNTDKLGCSAREMREIYDYAETVICFSYAEQEEMRLMLNYKLDRGVPEEKIHVIPNGVDTAFFSKDPSDIRHNVLSVGRREHNKGHHRVIEACKKLGIPVIIVGGGGDEEYIEKLEGYKYAGLQSEVPYSDMPYFYRQAQVYVLGSTDERMSLSLLEAAASGCNLVSSTGNRGNGVLGGKLIVIDPENKDALMCAIQKEWLRKRNWANHREQMIDLTWLEIARRIKEVYKAFSNL